MSGNFRNKINLSSYFWKTGQIPVLYITARNSEQMEMLVPVLVVETMLIYMY